jgi:hypothetical protein
LIALAVADIFRQVNHFTTVEVGASFAEHSPPSDLFAASVAMRWQGRHHALARAWPCVGKGVAMRWECVGKGVTHTRGFTCALHLTAQHVLGPL